MIFRFIYLAISSSFLPLSHASFPEAGVCWNSINALIHADVCSRVDSSSYALPIPGYDCIASQRPVNATVADSAPPLLPWTHHPICNDAKGAFATFFCVFTDANFAGGRGISLIGTPDSVELISRNRIFHPHLDPDLTEPQSLTQPFEVRALPGRGFGLLANTTLQLGDRVLEHTPVIAVQSSAQDLLSQSDVWELFGKGVDQLPSATRDMLLALQGHDEGDEVYSRFTTNAFELFDYDALFPETARLNHDCRPNARYYFDKKTFTHNVHATRTILPGEEITISYLSHYLPSSARAHKTHKNWHFTCTCTLCASSLSSLAASDTRLARIADIELEISEGRGTPGLGEELVELYEEEGLEAPAAKAYEVAARAYRDVGDREMAREYAQKAVRMGTFWLGPGSPDFQRVVRLQKELEELV